MVDTKNKRAVILLSGGLDSTTCLAIAKSEGFEVYTLSFDYGQRHKHELDLARINAERSGAKKHLVINANLREIGNSALTDDIAVPKNNEETQKTEIPVTYVPARNTIFLSFALAWAETLSAEDIFIGVNAIDYSGYPDCRPEFIKSFEETANLATKVSVEGKMRFKIRTPLIALTKTEIIKKGMELGVDYSLTWSCYDPVIDSGDYKPCMQCDSCILRTRGFKEANLEDPQRNSK